MEINNELLQKLIIEVEELQKDKIEMKNEILNLQKECSTNKTEISQLEQKMTIFENKINNLEIILSKVDNNTETIISINKNQNDILNKFVDANIEIKKQESGFQFELSKIRWQTIGQYFSIGGIGFIIIQGIMKLLGM